MQLLDVFVHGNTIVVWTQDGSGKNHYFTHAFRPIIFFHTFNAEYAREVLHECQVETTTRKDFVKKTIPVLKITFPSIEYFTANIHAMEERLRNVGTFYHVDIALPEIYIFEHGLIPFGEVEIGANEKNEIQSIRCTEDPGRLDYPLPAWKTMELSMEKNALGQLIEWRANGQVFTPATVSEFMRFFEEEDPDLILLHHPPKMLVSLLTLCRIVDSLFSFSRFGRDTFNVREKSYFSYGKIYAKPSPTMLKGRHLLAEYPHEGEGSEFTLLSYVEGSRVCRRTLQGLVSHSIGAASNNRLMFEAYRSGWLIPYKVGLYEKIKPFAQLIENDRGPFTYEPTLGFHSNVVELDFASMYPSIMHHYNLSPEKQNCTCCPRTPILDTGYSFCTREKGIVPRVCADFISRRQAYKQRPDEVSKAKVSYLKWLLVVIFGYQACTHKKIGTIEIHETINALARESMMDTIHLAEAHGFTVLHAIVDALYVTKKNHTAQDISTLISAVNDHTHLKLEYKQSFSRMVFLPSIANPQRPVPGRFYGFGTDGKMKLRGIEARQKSQPWIIRAMQTEVLEEMAAHPQQHPLEWYRTHVMILQKYVDMLPHALPEHIAFSLRLSKVDYATNIPQKQVVYKLKRKGVELMPGHAIQYVIQDARQRVYVPLSEYAGKFDTEKYGELLKKAYMNLFLPLYPTLNELNDLLEGKKQMRVVEYLEMNWLKVVNA